MTQPSPETLMARVADGDADAYRLLFELMAAPVLRSAESVLRDHAQSEEVAQEVLLELWLRRNTFDANKAKVITWLSMMTRNRAIDRVRASESSRQRDVRIGIRDWFQPCDDASHRTETQLEYRRALHALERLPLTQRRAIALCYIDGLSRTEVARALDVALSTSNWHIREGLAALRRVLDETN